MKINFATIIGPVLLCTGTAHGQTNAAAIPADRICIYRVPLVCPAAPEIGCGSHAKPILLAFEQERTIASAWLNRAGTLMTVVWKPDATGKQRSATFKRVSKTQELEATELRGAERKKALADFLSGEGWLRGADVDRLSEKEAEIMARRLIRKIRSLVPLTPTYVFDGDREGILDVPLALQFLDTLRSTPRMNLSSLPQPTRLRSLLHVIPGHALAH